VRTGGFSRAFVRRERSQSVHATRGPIAVRVLFARHFCLLLALSFATLVPLHHAHAQPHAKTPRVEGAAAGNTIDALAHVLTQGYLVLSDGAGSVLGTRQRGNAPIEHLSERQIVETLSHSHLTRAQSGTLWAFFADFDNAALATLPIVKALLAASDTPAAREALWGELSSLALGPARTDRRVRERSLLSVFERQRAVLVPLMIGVRETPSSCDDMIVLMLKSRIFAEDLDGSVTYVSGRIPAAVARYIERERGLGRPVGWEYTAFESMMRWKDAHLVPGAGKAQLSQTELEEAGEDFVTIFNCLHDLDEGFREVILRGLGPLELFNAVVAGEKELYRLGTSSYRAFLHPVIMQGIAERASFEAFLDRATDRRSGGTDMSASGHRGLVFIRVASSFGLLEPVLQTVHDPQRLIDYILASLDDAASFRDNSLLVLDVLTAKTSSHVAPAFKSALLDRLYERYRSGAGQSRNAYGSILSVYQTITGDHRDKTVDTDFALDDTAFQVPFDRLFSQDGRGGFVHRMFMRMDGNEDAVSTYEAFLRLMESLDASVEKREHFDVFRLTGPGRTVEVYANAPSAAGLREGLANIAKVLEGRRVETVIGRGHSSIVAPLQADAKRLLGSRINEVSSVILGSCGGDVSVRELTATFGYITYVATKATGRQEINNAIIKTYARALMALPQGRRLSVAEVLDKSVARFKEDGTDDALRSDASLYQVNMTAVLTARLFDNQVRQQRESDRRAALD
jgi:hypothetical protein